MSTTMKKKKQQSRPAQRGGFFLGLIVGLLVGLAMALGVALYISKVPVPFVNKVPQRTAEQDAAEAEKNKNWDPNNGLYGRNPAKPSSSPEGAAPASSSTATPASAPLLPPAPASAAPRKDPRDPADILADKPWPAPAPADAYPPPPEGGASTRETASVTYFVQAGAFSSAADAEQQRGKLALMGLQAKLNERVQGGRTVYRVRLGPFDKREDANQTKEKLEAASIEAALVQVQK
jgi:cell division protein FtsN